MKHLLSRTTLSLFLLVAVSNLYAEQKLTDQLTLSGVLEVDAFSLDQDVSGDTADIIVSTLEVALEAALSEQLGVNAVFLYEDGFNGVEVDEAIITLSLSEAMSLTAGKTTVPFGRFDSAMLSDPLTLELAETGDTVIQIGVGKGSISGSVTLFNGDNEELTTAPDDDQFRAALALDFSSENLDAGMSWVSNLDSDTLGGLSGTGISQDVAGLGVYLTWRSGALTLGAEHIGAVDDYRAGDFGGDVTVLSQPVASSVELAYALGQSATLAVAVQRSREAAFTGLKEEAVLLGYTRSLQSNLDIGLEFRDAEDYSVANGGAGDDSSQLTLRLSAAF